MLPQFEASACLMVLYWKLRCRPCAQSASVDCWPCQKAHLIEETRDRNYNLLASKIMWAEFCKSQISKFLVLGTIWCTIFEVGKSSEVKRTYTVSLKSCVGCEGLAIRSLSLLLTGLALQSGSSLHPFSSTTPTNSVHIPRLNGKTHWSLRFPECQNSLRIQPK